MKKHAGKFLIMGVFLIGIGTAAINIVYRYSITREVLAHYGGDAAALLTSGDSTATLLKLRPATESEPEDVETLEIAGQTYVVAAEKDVTKAPGYRNARNALTIDDSYDEYLEQPVPVPWRYVLRLAEEGNRVDIAFTPECTLSMISAAEFADASRPVPPKLGEPIEVSTLSNALKKLFTEQLPDETADETPTEPADSE